MIKYIVPHYYKEFVCTAQRCAHNCCRGGWLIELTEDIVKKYEDIEGESGRRLRESVMTDEEGCYVFCLQDGVCPHLEQSGLCGVYRELGPDYMGTVCREFPRFSYAYGDRVEAGIGLACEEAARIILLERQPFALKEIELSKTGLVTMTCEKESEPEKEYLDFLQGARDYILRILWGSEGTIAEKIKRILDLSQHLQRHINCGNYNEIEDFSKKVQGIELEPEWDEELCRMTRKLVVDIYRNLEQLNEEWIKRAEGIEESLLNDAYKTALDGLENGKTVQLQLLSYFIYRYFMKSAEDYNVSDKLLLCVCCYVVLMAQFASAKASKASGELSIEELVEEARIFSRQVEYSDNNIETLLEEFNFGDELSESRIKWLFF